MPLETGIDEYRSGFVRLCLFGSNVKPDECRMLLVGQMLSTGTATPLTVTPVYSGQEAEQQFGAGSYLAEAVKIALQNRPDRAVYCLPVQDVPGAAPQWDLTITGPATGSGTLAFSIWGHDFAVPVNNGDTDATIATAVAAAVNADTSLPFTASASGGTVSFTARHTGANADEFSIVFNPYFGQQLPDGVSVAYSQVVSTPAEPVITSAQIEAALGNCCYDCIGILYQEPTTIANFARYLDDETGTWACNGDQCFGHMFHHYSDTSAANIVSYGNATNDPQRTIIPHLTGYRWPGFAFTAAWAARTCIGACVDPSRPVVRDNGLLVPLEDAGECAGIWTRAEKEALVRAGVAVWDVSNQRTQSTSLIWIENNVTNYKTNAFGQADETWQQVGYRYAAARLARELRAWFEANWSSHALVSDGTTIPPGKKAVSPAVLETALKAFLRGYGGIIIEDAGGLDGKVLVERDTEGKPCGLGDSNRVNVLINADLINYLLRVAIGINVSIERKNCTTA